MPIFWILSNVVEIFFASFGKIKTLAVGIKPFLGDTRVTFQQYPCDVVILSHTPPQSWFPVSQPTHLLFLALLQLTISQLFSCAYDKRLNQRL